MPELYPFQQVGVDFLSSRHGAILGDDMGLGKSCQALLAAAKLDAFPILVVCPNSATGVWIDEAAKWLDIEARTYLGPRRQLARDDPIVVTNYAVFGEILRKRAWRLVIYDEGHKFRNGRVGGKNKTRPKLFASAIKGSPQYTFIVTGSPVVNDADDLWPLLHLIHPNRWTSYWSFVNKYMFKMNNGFGWSVEGVKDVAGLRRDLAPFLLRRRKGDPDVQLQLPAKRRQGWPIKMTPLQRKAYDEIADNLLMEYPDGGFLAVPSEIAKLTRLRQLLVTPQLLGLDEPGAAFEALRDLFVESPHPAVVFTPFAQAIPFLQSHLAGAMETWVIRGGRPAEEITATSREFERSRVQNKLLIATVGMATSWSATSASTAYFLEYDWAPKVNEQAEDRLHRHGQLNPVLCRYFVHNGTVDEHELDIMDRKTTIAKLAVDPAHFLRPRHRAPIDP